MRLGCSNPRLQTAIDIGCGSGQSTFTLCDHFGTVLGFDVSEAQLAEARESGAKSEDPKHRKVIFQAGLAHELGSVPDASVDLVTIAQALHWVDTDKFYRESKRILRRDGVLAAYGYGTPVIMNRAAQDILHEVLRCNLNIF